MRKSFSFMLLVAVTLLVGGSAVAQDEPSAAVYRVELPPQIEGTLYYKSSLNNGMGPVTPLPVVKRGPQAIEPPGGFGPAPGSPSAAVSNGISRNGMLGGALPGGASGLGAGDPVAVAERQMKKLIRRLDR